MRLRTNWHATWTPWADYTDRQTGQQYSSRSRQLFCGKMLIATLVQDTRAQFKCPFYMYSQNLPTNARTVRGPTAFRTARKFIREKLA